MGLYSLQGFPATRKLAEPLNTRAFVGANPTGELRSMSLAPSHEYKSWRRCNLLLPNR